MLLREENVNIEIFFLQKVKWSHWESHGKTWKVFWFASRTFSCASYNFDLFFFISCIVEVPKNLFSTKSKSHSITFHRGFFYLCVVSKVSFVQTFQNLLIPWEKKTNFFLLIPHSWRTNRGKKKKKKKGTTKTYVYSMALHTDWISDDGGRRKGKKDKIVTRPWTPKAWKRMF